MSRKIAAYCAASLIGAVIYRARWLLVRGDTDYFFAMLFLDTILIGILVLPFWLVVVSLAGRMRFTTLPFYLISGAVIGMLIEPLLLASFPPMMWDTELTFHYNGRLLQIFRANGMVFALMGVAASACYWLLSNRYKRQRPTTDM